RSRTLRSRKLSTPSDYDRRIDEKLVNAGFFHISQIRGKLTSQSTLISALVERWVNWVVPNKEQRRWQLHHYRQMFDNMTNDSFLWTPYDEHRLHTSKSVECTLALNII
ncbi:hypothetical protein PIB30_107968, partial [Stylosanthes scabra]|nr:hypothetical protein [Stylosanthes scabra]